MKPFTKKKLENTNNEYVGELDMLCTYTNLLLSSIQLRMILLRSKKLKQKDPRIVLKSIKQNQGEGN